MTDKQMTDEELWENHSYTERVEGGGVEVMNKMGFMEAIKESRKGMFTEEEVKDFGMFMCEPNWKGIDTDFEQWLTERKGR